MIEHIAKAALWYGSCFLLGMLAYDLFWNWAEGRKSKQACRIRDSNATSDE